MEQDPDIEPSDSDTGRPLRRKGPPHSERVWLEIQDQKTLKAKRNRKSDDDYVPSESEGDESDSQVAEEDDVGSLPITVSQGRVYAISYNFLSNSLSGHSLKKCKCIKLRTVLNNAQLISANHITFTLSY